jgi:hypothetical protein
MQNRELHKNHFLVTEISVSWKNQALMWWQYVSYIFQKWNVKGASDHGISHFICSQYCQKLFNLLSNM